MGGNILLNVGKLTHFSLGTVMPEPNHISNFIQQFCFWHKNHLINSYINNFSKSNILHFLLNIIFIELLNNGINVSFMHFFNKIEKLTNVIFLL